jgi:hypothetical protein
MKTKIKPNGMQIVDGQLTTIKKTKSEKDLIIEETICLFKDINEGVQALYGRKPEREKALYLHNKYGKDKLINMIKFIPTYNKGITSKTGYGKIIKPTQLLSFIQDLIDAKRKFDRELNYQLQKEEMRKKEIEEAQELKKLQDSYTLEEKERMRKERNEKMKQIIKGF